MKVTFITGHLCKERHALLNELALDLGEYGVNVTVLTGFPSRRISAEVRNYYLVHPVEKISNNVLVRRIGTKKGEGSSLFLRMIKYFMLTYQLYCEAKNTPTDVYYLYSTPPFLGWIGTKLKNNAPTLYNAQDLFPDTLVHMKHVSESNLLIRYLRLMERKTYEQNTRVVTISDDMKRSIVKSSKKEIEVNVISNWADIKVLFHVNRNDNKLMDELGICKNKFIISYAGDIGLFQGWDVILDAAKQIGNITETISFVIIGSGSYKEVLEKRIMQENINNIQVFPLQSQNRLSEIYSIGNFELVPIECGITKMALPSKIGVIMASGNTILALLDSDSMLAQEINNRELGVAITHGDASLLTHTILYYYDKTSMLESYGYNARKYAEQNFDRSIQTKKYYDVLCNLVKRGN